jgi:transcriptional regulator of arginine metabolism
LKQTRQKQILEIINNNIILTQEDLQNELLNLGFEVTQSTVSRDIKELKLVKSHDKDGNYRYVSHRTINSDSTQKNLFASSVMSVDYALNNVVIKCHTGMASGACVALDEMFHEYMLGSLAGDDTIMVAVRTTEETKEVMKKIREIP